MVIVSLVTFHDLVSSKITEVPSFGKVTQFYWSFQNTGYYAHEKHTSVRHFIMLHRESCPASLKSGHWTHTWESCPHSWEWLSSTYSGRLSDFPESSHQGHIQNHLTSLRVLSCQGDSSSPFLSKLSNCCWEWCLNGRLIEYVPWHIVQLLLSINVAENSVLTEKFIKQLTGKLGWLLWVMPCKNMKLNLIPTAFGHRQASPALCIYLYYTPCIED